MNSDKLGCTVFAIAAVILAISTFNIFQKQEKFTEVLHQAPNGRPRYSTGPDFETTQKLENYQNSVVMNVGTSVDQVNKTGASYYLNLQNYLNPSLDNLELASNISARPVQAGVPLPGASDSYTNSLGNGYVNNLGHLNGNAYPPVSYQNNRASQLSKCAKDLPMFAASSLLPKPSANADNNALSQSAARALAAFTALSPVEQIGAITSTNLPYSKTTDFRAIEQIPQASVQSSMFYTSPAGYIPPTYGSVNSQTFQPGPNYNNSIN